MPAAEVARRFGTPVPVLDLAKLAGIPTLRQANRSYVRLNAQGELVWCATSYRSAQSPDGPEALTLRVDNGLDARYQVFPAGSPSSRTHHPREVPDYLPEPGLLLPFEPGPMAMWTQGPRLFTAVLNPSVAAERVGIKQ